MITDDEAQIIVARAICKADGYDPDSGSLSSGDVPNWGRYIVHAQAAMKAVESVEKKANDRK